MAKKVSVGVKIDGNARGFKDSAKQAERATQKLRRKARKESRSMRNAFYKIGVAISAAFAIKRVAEFFVNMIKLGGEVTGVRKAFEKLNKPGLLSNLRKATRGTVTDMKLMKASVQASNFRIPLSELATYFKFATNRAIETGESVDYLVDSIIKGIGRKSGKILDNLGISLIAIQDELKLGGTYAEAVGRIIQRELGEAGDVADTTAISVTSIGTAFKNLKAAIGEKATEWIWLKDVIEGMQKLADWIDKGNESSFAGMTQEDLGAELDEQIRLLEQYEFGLEAIQQTAKTYDPGTVTGLQQMAALKKDLLAQIELIDKTKKGIEELKNLLDEPDPDGGSTEKEIITLSTLKKALKEKQEVIEATSILEIERLKILYDELDVIEAQIKAVEDLKDAIEKVEAPTPLKGKGLVPDVGASKVPTDKLIPMTEDEDKAITEPFGEMSDAGMDFVNSLESAFAGFFQNTEGGFEAMADSFGRALQQMAAEFAAKAAMFFILSAITGGPITGAAFKAYMGMTSATKGASGTKSMGVNSGTQTINVQGVISGRDLALINRRNV